MINALSKNISFQTSVKEGISHEVTIKDILDTFKNGTYEAKINELRRHLASGNNELYGIHKRRLPAVTFSGTFEGKRQICNLKNYNFICTIDIDHINAAQMSTIYNYLLQDGYVITFWVSPSGSGYKGLVEFSYSGDIPKVGMNSFHTLAFSKLLQYFKNNYEIELDKSGSDISRLCFVSHDENLILKEKYSKFEINIIDEDFSKEVAITSQNNNNKNIENISFDRKKHLNPINKNKAENRHHIQKYIKFFKKNNLSITADYDSWYRVGFAIANSFSYDLGEKYYLDLCRLDKDNHNEAASIQMLQYCYCTTRHAISFLTIKHYFDEIKELQRK